MRIKGMANTVSDVFATIMAVASVVIVVSTAVSTVVVVSSKAGRSVVRDIFSKIREEKNNPAS